MKVYLVTRQYYEYPMYSGDPYWVCDNVAIFSTKEKAEEFIGNSSSYEIEEYTLDN